MSPTKTFYAPARRAGRTALTRAFNIMDDSFSLKEIFSAMPEVAALLNRERQIIYSNDALLSLLPGRDQEEILGMRPGEAISCIHSRENEGGCGTSEHCRYCGAVNAVLESQEKNEKVVKECRIVSFIEDEEVSFDFRITASPLETHGESFTIIYMQDISSEKRKKALEHIFFHDIINTAGGIKGFLAFLKQTDDPQTIREYIRILDKLGHDLVDDILSQRALILAEAGDLEVNPQPVNAAVILDEVRNTVSYHEVAAEKEIVVRKNTGDVTLICDPILLRRVLINMLNNALEATYEKGQVLMGYFSDTDGVTFFVHNDISMAENVKMQVFKRSFSTHGSDRGLGTYSMKLLTERYLKGKVWFDSDRDSGTTFHASIPYNPGS